MLIVTFGQKLTKIIETWSNFFAGVASANPNNAEKQK